MFLAIVVKLGEHRIIVSEICIPIIISLGVMAHGGGAIITQPLNKELAKDNQQRELPKAPRNTSADALILEEIRMPRQIQRAVEILAQDDLHLHEIDTCEEVQRHGQENQPEPQARRTAAGQRIRPDDLPKVQISGDKEDEVHDHMPGVLGDGELI